MNWKEILIGVGTVVAGLYIYDRFVTPKVGGFDNSIR